MSLARAAKTSSACCLAILVLLTGGAASPQSTSPNSASSSTQIIQFLDQTIDWYRHQTAEQQIATDPGDILAVSDNRQIADQVVRLAFEFARAQADSLAKQGASGQALNQSTGSSQYQALLQLQAKIDRQVEDTQAELDGLRHKFETAAGKKRQQLQSQIGELEAELELAKARRDAMHSMAGFVNGTSSTGLGGPGLRSQIQALADSIPALANASPNSEALSASKEQVNSALLAAKEKPAVSGIWDLTADLIVLSRKIRTVEAAAQETDALAKNAEQIRTPLTSRLRELSRQGDQLAEQADSAGPAELQQQKQQLDSLAARFKEVSAAAIPLSKQRILLDLYRRGLTNWENSIRNQRAVEVKGLLVRLVFLALLIGMVIAAADLWRRAVYRYVHDARRRYQYLLLRKFVLWSLITLIIAFAFASKLGSIVTFAGLITAGVVVALQNVILAIVGYFLLIGKYGIRVGDRVQVGGVTGEVIDIGLVRLHLMELSSGEYIPTGRVVAFANTIVFQPAAGLFKQVPGTNFLWHEISLRLSLGMAYDSPKQRLLGVVERVLADYREEMDRQNRAMATSRFSVGSHALRPTAQVHFTVSALEIVIRFPVDLEHAAEIDERVTHELLRELDREPKLKLDTSEGPAIRDTTLTYS